MVIVCKMDSLKCIVLIVFCEVIVLDAVKFRCDYTYHGLGWFKYHKIPMAGATRGYNVVLKVVLFNCAMLASPTTEVIRNIMRNEIINKGEIFTGIHSTLSKEQYYTIDGIPLSVIPHTWAEFEPDNENDEERCISFNSDGKISDVNCDKPLPYICYRENSDIDVTVCGTPDTEYHFDTRTNKCYKLHTTPRQYTRAFFACSAEGGHLAIINSNEEAQVLIDVFSKYPAEKIVGSYFYKDAAFIGFNNWGEASDFTTIDGQSLEEAGYAKFSRGQPDNGTGGQYCGSVLRTGLLDDIWCENHYAFFCEKKPNFLPVCDNTYVKNDKIAKWLNTN